MLKCCLYDCIHFIHSINHVVKPVMPWKSLSPRFLLPLINLETLLLTCLQKFSGEVNRCPHALCHNTTESMFKSSFDIAQRTQICTNLHFLLRLRSPSEDAPKWLRMQFLYSLSSRVSCNWPNSLFFANASSSQYQQLRFKPWSVESIPVLKAQSNQFFATEHSPFYSWTEFFG